MSTDSAVVNSNQRSQGHPAWVIRAILLAFLVLATVTSLVNPLFESTDEIRHYRYIRHLVVRRALPVQGTEATRSQSHHPPLYYILSALASAWVRSPHPPEYEQAINPFWGYRDWAVGVDNKLQYLHSSAERFPFREGYLAAMIPRWVNVILGAIAVLLTYKLGRRLWPDRPALAWGAAALVAFNPQFLYLSAAMNNDVVAAATSAAVLLACLELIQQGPRRDRLLRLGLAYGLALLAKLHLLILGGAVALAVWLAVTRSAGQKASPPGRRAHLDRATAVEWLRAISVPLGVAALLAGWWFLRNWWLYGDPTALNKVNELWSGRPAGGNWWALKQGLPHLWSSLWGRFGYGQIPLPQPFYSGLLVFCLFALVGYVIPGRRSGSSRPRQPHHSVALLLLSGTVLGFALVVAYYILIQPASPMGRFLFPALPPLTILVMEGLDRWPLLAARPRWTATAVLLGIGALALVALGGYLAPAVRYPAPAPASLPGQPLEVRFGDLARALSVDVQPNTLRPGETLDVTVVWEPLRQTEVPFAVYVHLIDGEDVLVAQRDTWPGLGRAPTTSWQPGRTFVDTYRLEIPATAYAPNEAVVRLGLYEPGAERLTVYTPDRVPLGDGIVVGEVSLEPQPGPWPNALDANFGDEITLVGYTLEPRSLNAGGTFTATLFWQVQEDAPLRHDYLVFAQVIDPDWHVWGSRDGAGPGWVPGQVVRDVRRITLLPETPPGSYPLQVGLFHGETGRLPVLAPQGHYIDERVLLGPVRVRE